MDNRRFLILAGASLWLGGCAVLGGETATPIVPAAEPVPAETLSALSGRASEAQAPPPVEDGGPPDGTRPYLAEAVPTRRPSFPIAAPRPPEVVGRAAIAAANSAASAPSRSDAFVGGVQVFAWSPGRVFEVWTAPLRVTTLTLGEGETLIAKAAGDTVRWQIGEALSGEGSGQRAHVLLKPLERGLETNLVLTTNKRVYLIELRSGAADAFNAAIAWDGDAGTEREVPGSSVTAIAPVRVPDPVVMPEGPLDAHYRVEPLGRRPRWTPVSVFNDGRRTFITFGDDLQADESPALFVIAADGEAQLVNYRQAGGLFIVDRVFDRAELRLGDRRPQVVRIRRVTGARS